MPDAVYDVVIIGGGNKALVLAMYLQRYAGMSVGVFERRHEAGGGWSTEESAAPGFLSNTHAQMMYLWMHFLPLHRDFPEFDLELDMHILNNCSIFKDTGNTLGIYSVKHDPMQERSAREIAKYSQRDADNWLAAWDMRDIVIKNFMMWVNSPALDFDMYMIGQYGALVEAFMKKGIDMDPIYQMYSHLQSNKEFWDSKELQSTMVRCALSCGFDITVPGKGLFPPFYTALIPYMSFCVGGTHQAAHACHKILIADGAKVWTHCDVDKVIIENGAAKGIRLTDGTEIHARKMVISTLSPQQLCFDLIGKEHLGRRIIRRIELLESKHACVGWYNWALNEPPVYTAAKSNPDINYTFWLCLCRSADPDAMARETYWRKLGKMAPFEDLNPVVWCHSRIDPRYAPPGKALASHENFMPSATALTEKEWLQLKKDHAEDMVRLWQDFAPNMTWDNVIGMSPDTPYDCLRLKNMGPEGNWNVIDAVPQQIGTFRPIPELSDYRTPIKNLYATGVGWPFGFGASVGEGYACYKTLAGDFDLPKPWLEPGKEEPDSLYRILLSQEKALQDKVKK